MYYIFCLIIVVVAVQPVLSGPVHQIYIEPIQLVKGLTATASPPLGKNIATAEIQETDLVGAAIAKILNVDGIAFVQLKPRNYIVISAKLIDIDIDLQNKPTGTLFTTGKGIGYCFRYDWTESPRGFGTAHVKIVTSWEKYNATHVKIFYESLEFTSADLFGESVLSFAEVKPGAFFMKLKEGDTLLSTPFSDLRVKYVGQQFNPAFIHFNGDILKKNPALKDVKGKIKEFSVTVGGTNILINDATTTGDLQKTPKDIAPAAATTDTQTNIKPLEYTFTFKFELTV